jgi:hypothetical protein
MVVTNTLVKYVEMILFVFVWQCKSLYEADTNFNDIPAFYFDESLFKKKKIGSLTIQGKFHVHTFTMNRESKN